MEQSYLVDAGLAVCPGSRAVRPKAVHSWGSPVSILVSAWGAFPAFVGTMLETSDTGVTAAVIIRIWQWGSADGGLAIVLDRVLCARHDKKANSVLKTRLSGAEQKIEITLQDSGRDCWDELLSTT